MGRASQEYDRPNLPARTYDCSRAPDWLRKAVRGGERWRASMTLTLEKLDALSRD